ncbi:MAG: putative LPS assembly protein LptD [Gemmatimonadales bacterium]
MKPSGRALALCAAFAASSALPWQSGLAQEEGAPRDSVPPDSVPQLDQRILEAQRSALPADTDSVAVDSTRVADVDERREALSEGGFPERDDVFSQLVALPGFRILEYRGARVELDLELESVRLMGEAQANYEEAVLRADSITYLARSRFISALGDIALLGPEQAEVVSDSGPLYYDVATLKGTIFDAETQFADRGATWRVRGDAIPAGTDTLFVLSGEFTSCELEQPHYRFASGQIKLVNENTLVAWPVVLYVGNVPIAWLPFIAQDIRPGRRSGLIPPRFGINDFLASGDIGRQITDFGYYWAINDFMDAQFTVDWFGGQFTRVNGAYRYKFLKNFLQGNLLTSYSFGETGNNLSLAWSHNQDLTPQTQLRINAQYVQNTRVFEDQSFDPREQTAIITSDLGLNHRFGFGNVSLSARRRQFLEEDGRVDLTLPSFNMSFSPVTLFRAPASREGAFNNLTWSGGLNFQRTEQSRDFGDDKQATTGGVTSSLTLHELSISGSANYDERVTVPADSLGNDLAEELQGTGRWNVGASYRLGLVGSTTLRPRVAVDGAMFRSDSTGRSFVTVPTRFNVGVTLTTDVFGFWPGFGPFSSIRHKFSPQVTWAYAPAVEVPDSIASIPGIPLPSGAAQNRLQINVNQTFEAKLKPRLQEEAQREELEVLGPMEAPEVRERPALPGELPAEEPLPEEPLEDELPLEGAGAEVTADSAAADSLALAAVTAQTDSAEAPSAGPGARSRVEQVGRRRSATEQSVVILSLNSTPLVFDFERKDQPKLVTERWRTNITSDLLRGVATNIEFDLFRGSGEDREFSMYLSSVGASFGFGSSRSLGSIFGLGRSGRDQPLALANSSQRLDSRRRLNSFDPDDRFDGGSTGPWNVQFNYSLVRSRPEEGGNESQSVGGTISLRPTPNWRMRWTTQYNITQGQFGAQIVTLERDLHRWQAIFGFSKSPNGNLIFNFSIGLKDAPELQFGYDQQGLSGFP